ncbi:MAG: dethiobiotin synthase [Gemmatimonadales bacterium]
MRRTVVVTGTDTGVGKTVVTCALARSLRARGHDVVAIKPIETGCDAAASAGEDGALLAAAAGQASPRVALHRFREPVAPVVAAGGEAETPGLASVVNAIRSRAAPNGITLVEGAGGLLSPLAWDWGLADLASALDASVLLVAADRLGSLNHTLLTVACLDQRGLELLGVVLSAPPEPDASTGGNAAVLARLLPGRRLAALPRLIPAERDGCGLDEVAGWLES